MYDQTNISANQNNVVSLWCFGVLYVWVLGTTGCDLLVCLVCVVLN